MSILLHTRKLFAIFSLTLALSTFANINIGNPDNITECFQSTTEGFDLTINNSIVLDGLDPNLYSVYYFDNQADSNNNTISNAISNPANYSTGSFGLAQVWVNVVEDADEDNFDNSTFLLISNQQPIANEPLNANTNTFFQPDVFFIGIDDIENNIYDLTEINSKIIQSQSGSFSIQYFENINDANNNVNPIQNPENFFIDPDDGPQHIIDMSARIEFANSDNCFDTVNFDIYVFNPQEDEFNTNDFSVCANPNGTTSINIQEQVLVDISEITFQIGVNFVIVDENGTSIANFENEIEGLEPVNIGISYRLVYPGVTIIEVSNSSFGINQNSNNQLTIFPIASPVIEDIENITSCSSGDEEITFDLTQNDALALGSQTGNFDISYHFTLPEANSGTNSVTDLGFDPTALSLDNFQQFIFLRIENADNPECFAVEFFTLVDAGNISANPPENAEFCSISGETNTIVDLTTLDAQIKGDQTSSNFIIEYFENDTFIDEPSNYSLDNETTTITAVLSLSNVDDCSDEVEFDITLKQTPEIQNLNDLAVCSDFDLNATFNLTENTSEALGTQNPNEVEVTYFTSLQDAEDNVNSLESQGIDLLNYTASSENESIFIRLQSSNSTACFVVDSFELQSFPVEINQVGDLVNCTESGETSAFFDLSQVEAELLPTSANETDYTIAYFDENDVEINNPENYEATSNEIITIEVANVNNPTCVETTSFNVLIEVTPEIQNLNDLAVCSDFDLNATFNLTENTSVALGTQNPNEVEVTYFTSLQDAEDNVNSLESQNLDLVNYSVTSENETIFIRLQSSNSTACFVVDSFELQSFPVEINQVGDLVNCTESGETSAFFDLSQVEAELLPTSANETDYTIAYFDENDVEINNPENYEATSSEIITIEVANVNNPTCVETTSFNVLIEVTPEIQNLNDLAVCSDFDLNATFNLTENTSEALGTQNPNEVEVTYFTSLQDAEDNVNSLESQGIDLLNYTASSENETIFIRLQSSESTDCFVVDSFELQSFPVEINQVGDLVNCTESGETSAFFDLSQVEAELLPTSANETDYTIVYFDENDVEINNPENYEATSSEIITIEVANVNNPTCVETTNFSLLIEVTPEIQNLNDLEACSNFDLNTTFNLTENTSEALGTQNPNEVEVTYFTSLQDAEDNVNSLESQGIDLLNYTASSENESIFIRLQSSNSTACFVVDSFELQSFPVEINEVDDIEECIDAESQTASFNLTDLETTLYGSNQNSTTHAIAFFDENGIEITSPDDFTITSSQSISAQISNSQNPTCFETTSINLIALAEDNPDCTLSIQQEVAFEFKTYPNPVSSQLFIESNEPISKIEVFDIKGKKLTTRIATQIEHVDFSNFPTGIYLLKLEVGNRSQMAKIIKK